MLPLPRLPHGLRPALPALRCAFGGALLWAATAWAGDPPTLRLQDFFQHPIGPRGLQMSDALLAARGREVRLLGYMVAQESPQPGRFLLTPRPVRLSEHADGEADDLPPATVLVLLAPTQADRVVQPRDGLVALTGVLEVGRAEGDDGRVSWVRLRLPAHAVLDVEPRATARR